MKRAILHGVILVSLAASAPACYEGCPDDKHQFCQRMGKKECGLVTGKNLCGEIQTITCGKCFGGDLCGGRGVPNICDLCTHPAVKKSCKDGWCTISSGCFSMGDLTGTCDLSSIKGFGKESVHRVALTHSFSMMEAEVTQQEFNKFKGYMTAKNVGHPSPPTTPNPMEYVSWHEAAAFANARSSSGGLAPCYGCTGVGAFIRCAPTAAYAGAGIYRCPGFRLPTEAEWEYAYRAGSKTDLYAESQGACDCSKQICPSLSAIGWWLPNAKGQHHPAKQLEANAWGLYDMSGNVWEWTHDWYTEDLGGTDQVDPAGPDSGDRKVIRGGGWAFSEPRFFRAAARRHEAHDHRCGDVGFRLARTLGAGPR